MEAPLLKNKGAITTNKQKDIDVNRILGLII